jgi:hypothetical protein
VEYITDRDRSGKLRVLKLNANDLSLRGVERLIAAVSRANYTLTRLEMSANQPSEEEEGDAARSEGDDDDDDIWEGSSSAFLHAASGNWKYFEESLRMPMARNMFMKRQVEGDALRLLHYARSIVLPSASPPQPPPVSSSSDSTTRNEAHARAGPRLPPELVSHILTFLSPSLSSIQRTRVLNYAQDRETLLPAPTGAQVLRFPSLHDGSGGDCLPDPTRLTFASSSSSPPSSNTPAALPRSPLWPLTPAPGSAQQVLAPGGPGSAHRCLNGCMGTGNSVRCWREEQRVRWLEEVGCDAPDVAVQPLI